MVAINRHRELPIASKLAVESLISRQVRTSDDQAFLLPHMLMLLLIFERFVR